MQRAVTVGAPSRARCVLPCSSCPYVCSYLDDWSACNAVTEDLCRFPRVKGRTRHSAQFGSGRFRGGNRAGGAPRTCRRAHGALRGGRL